MAATGVKTKQWVVALNTTQMQAPLKPRKAAIFAWCSSLRSEKAGSEYASFEIWHKS